MMKLSQTHNDAWFNVFFSTALTNENKEKYDSHWTFHRTYVTAKRMREGALDACAVHFGVVKASLHETAELQRSFLFSLGWRKVLIFRPIRFWRRVWFSLKAEFLFSYRVGILISGILWSTVGFKRKFWFIFLPFETSTDAKKLIHVFCFYSHRVVTESLRNVEVK